MGRLKLAWLAAKLFVHRPRMAYDVLESCRVASLISKASGKSEQEQRRLATELAYKCIRICNSIVGRDIPEQEEIGRSLGELVAVFLKG